MKTHHHPIDQRDDQIRRVARVLEIIQQIASAPKYWNRRTLAEYHEISERMVQKDLELIRIRLGLKLIRKTNGYCFEQLPHLPTTSYSFSEALALLSAARLAQNSPGVNSTELAAAIARLETIFPDDMRPLLREAADQIPRRAVKGRLQDMLALLHRAFVEHTQVRILYATASHVGAPVNRIVEPYHILPYGRSWHLIAFDNLRKEVLQFKINRVLEAELLESGYSIPADFNIDEYMGDSWGIMRGSAQPAEEVILLFERQAGTWVSEEVWHKSQQVEILPDGRVRIRFFVGITPEMISWLLYYGEYVFVEKPEWLRKEVRERHHKSIEKG